MNWSSSELCPEEITNSFTLQEYITHYNKKYKYYHNNSLSLCGIFVRLLYPLFTGLDHPTGLGFILFSYILVIQFSRIILSNPICSKYYIKKINQISYYGS